MNFRWNFVFHHKLTSQEVMFSHPETLKSYSFQREAFELMFSKFHFSWSMDEYLRWASDLFSNPEEFHSALEKTRIIIPDRAFAKNIHKYDHLEDELTLEEMALGTRNFSSVKLTSVLLEVPERSHFLLTSENVLKIPSGEDEKVKNFKVVSLREQRFAKCTQIISRNDYNSFLDFGCGNGDLYQYLADHIGSKSYRGYDSDLNQIIENRARFSDDLFITEFKNQKFELVIFLEVLEHMPAEDARNLVRKYLKEGSDVFLTMPNKDYNQHFPNRPSLRHPDHIHEWSEKEFEEFMDILKSEKFEVQREDLGRSVKNTRPTLSAHIRSYHGHKRPRQSQ